jgi:hypothetical protein
MAKKRKSKVKRRPGPTVARKPKPSFRRGVARAKKSSWKPVLAGIAGGLGTAGVGYLMVRAGMSPMTAAVGLTAAGGVAALTTEGNLQAAALGSAGMGTGQLALALIAGQAGKPAKKKTEVAEAAPAKERDDAYAGDIESAFERARQKLALEDEAALDDECEEAA